MLRRLKRSSFRLPIALKLALSVTLTVAIGMVALAVLIIDSQNQLLREQIEDFGQLINQQLAASAIEPLFTDQFYLLDALVERIADQPSILGAAIYNHEGRQVARTGLYPRPGSIPAPGEFRRLPPDQLVGGYSAEPALVHSEVIAFKDATGGFATLVFSERALHDARREVVWSTLLMAAGLVLAIVPLGIFLGRRLARPIHTLVDATRLMEQGQFTEIAERRTDEFGLLIEQINNMAAGLVRKGEVEELMRQVLDREVAGKLLQQIEPVRLGGEKVFATVLFADIVGFTALSEQLSPEAVSEFLNEYFHYFNVCSRFYFGTVDKFIGDAVMIVFGVPRPDPEHQYHAVACALLMQRLAGRLNAIRVADGQPAVELRIGINSGDMLAGLVGSSERLEYTVVGDAVNLASRLCNEAEGGDIIIEDSLYQSLTKSHGLEVSMTRQIRLRGKREPVTIYTVSSMDHSYPIVLDQLIDDVLQGWKNSAN